MSLKENDIYYEAELEMKDEDVIERACNADLNNPTPTPERLKLTLLDASILAGLITYRFILYVWDKEFRPISDLEYETETEARRQVRYLRKRGLHGLIQPIVRRKGERGFMGYHATIGKSWSF